MVSETVLELTVIIGSALGATAAALLPFWQKLREMQALGQPLKFEKKYIGTIFIAFIVGIVGAVLSFDDNMLKVDPTWTVVKIFIVSAIAAATSNVTLNRFLSVSGALVQLKGLQSENQRLAELVNLNKNL